MSANRGIELAILYAPRDRRAALAAVFDLDERLAGIVRTTSEPILGQIRLTWWHEALAALDTGPPPSEPVLRALAATLPERGVSGLQLADLVTGWEALLDPDALDEQRIEAHAAGRARLVALIGRILGAVPGDPVTAAGRGWALADLAAQVQDDGLREHLARLAAPELDRARAHRWSRQARAIGALALMAAQELRGTAPPARIVRLAWHRLTGR